MLSVAEALAAILAEVIPPEPVTVSLADAHGLVLAEDAVCDLDSPPFDKSLMDGFAVRAEDLNSERTRLFIIEEVMAGQVPQKFVGRGEATRIMTGAPLPAGANLVIPVEQTQLAEDAATVLITLTHGSFPKVGANILKRGASTRAGQRLMQPGHLLRAQELGCLAELGRSRVRVFPRPRVAVLATGDELVPIENVPAAGQIRNSNESMLVAQIRQAGAEPVPLGIARDERGHLRERILRGLEHDVLLLSGGVSAGVLDLVPAELEAAGVRQVFHKVRVKPGQPIWFGVLDRPVSADSVSRVGGSGRCYVFGLPGNPVSSMVCFELFARTAIRRCMGLGDAAPQSVPAKLTVDWSTTGNRPTYHPAKMTFTGEGPVVEPVAWVGSADLSATIAANCMLLLPAGDHHFRAGEFRDVYPW